MSLHQYQEEAAAFLAVRLFVLREPGAGLFLDPGLGKTRTTLTVLDRLRTLGETERTLVVAPIRPMYSVWPNEIKKWRFDFTHQVIHGTPNQRTKALYKDADIHLVNPEGLLWLAKQDSWPWDTLVIDESTKFKNWTAKRTRALRKVALKSNKRIILTGTPSPNALSDLFSQIFILDGGESLGKTITFFRNKYMKRGGYLNYSWTIRDENAREEVAEAIHPLVLTMKAEDHLDMPRLVFNDIWIDLEPNLAADYKQLEKQLFLALDGGEDLIVSGAGGCYAACKGFANGGVYEQLDDGGRETHHIHKQKVNALADLLDELGGKPALIAYQFDHDLERIEAKLGKLPVINGKTKPKELQESIDAFNAGRTHLVVQPQACSHGLNLQQSANDVIWYGLTDQPEVYEQLNRRIYRQGVSGQVRIHRLLVRNTVEEMMLARITDKGLSQTKLIEALKAYRKSHGR